MGVLSKSEIEAWKRGTYFESYRKLGAHTVAEGTSFCVWVPGVDKVSVIGDFNDWDAGANPLTRSGSGTGIFWSGTVRDAGAGHRYKYNIRVGRNRFDKGDPYGFAMEPPEPGGSHLRGLSSIVTDLTYDWSDDEWMRDRSNHEGMESRSRPVSIYEVHPGSWRRRADGGHLTYAELAAPLISYVHEMGFTHVEFMPVMEHPFYASWGYQVAGYYAPTYRYGSPLEFKKLIDELHRAGIGVYLDWVPAHFATDSQGLAHFNGGPLYEYEDPLMQSHPDWGTNVFDYDNPCVRNFLISNALFWLDEYHLDGLRFDAVASMLYRDYSREEFSPNVWGGRENLEACTFLRDVNNAALERFPAVSITAEEATAWPNVTGSTEHGGLGFAYKWNMGWMNDTLAFMRKNPIYRSYHFEDVTFPLVYAFSEQYTSPLSHDEVVHGKGSLWGKMPGFDSEKAANLKLLFGHLFGHPGKKLLFMGGELGQVREWDHDRSLDWHLLEDKSHAGIQRWVKALNQLYASKSPLWNDRHDGFEWIDFSDSDGGIVSYVRRSGDQYVVFVFNFSGHSYPRYRIGIPVGGRWRVLLNSQSKAFAGSGRGSKGPIKSSSSGWHYRPYSIVLGLPALGVLVLEPENL
jgi:1,4-alpha-glucan branching enzyme